jgi:adenine-specific DNA-methyltransferase
MAGELVATGSGKRNDTRLNEVRLVYPGKSDESEILGSEYASFELIETKGEGSNLLFDGDNLAALLFMLNDLGLRESLDFVYIDPPYASQSSFESRTQKHAYEDHLVGAEYLESLRCRLVVIRELMKSTAAISVHIDERMSSYVRIILDEIFGASNFRNEITRVKSNPKNYTSKTFGNVSDRILIYSKSASYKWNRPFTDWTDETSAKEYTYVEEGTGRRYKKVPVHAPGARNGDTGGEWKGMLPPPGKHWQYKPSTLDEMDARGEIYWSSTGNPRRKVYLDESKGVAIQDVWLDVKDPFNQNAKITGYPTEKNPMILERLIKAFTDEGDLVLDCYLGSGTTADVAQELNRRWIGVDESPEALITIMKRLTHGTQKMGDFRSSPEAELEVLFEIKNDLNFKFYKVE